MNREQIKDFLDRIRGRFRSNKRYRKLVGDFGKESLEDRFERYDFDHKDRKLAKLLRQINIKEADLESYRRLRREMTVSNFDSSNPSLVSRINRLDSRINDLEAEIRDLRILYEDERRKLDTLRSIVRGPKEGKVEQALDLDLQSIKTNAKEKIESISVEKPEPIQRVGVEEIPKSVQETGVEEIIETPVVEETPSTTPTTDELVSALKELEQKLLTERDKTSEVIDNSEGTQLNVEEPIVEEPRQTSIEIESPDVSLPSLTNQAPQYTPIKPLVQISYTPNDKDPDYLKLIASDKMSEFARGYRMVKREERRSRTYKFFEEITMATGYGMMVLSSYFVYGLAAYEAPNGPINFWETIYNDVVQKISSDPSFENVMNTLGHGPAQFLLGAVFFGLGLKGYFKFKKQYKDAKAKRVDMEDLNAVTMAPTTENLARHI